MVLTTIPNTISELMPLLSTINIGFTDSVIDLSWAMFAMLGMGWFSKKAKNGSGSSADETDSHSPAPMPISSGQEPEEANDLVDMMLSQGRFPLLLRPQISAGLDENHFRLAMAALEDGMGLVPDGEVTLERTTGGASDNPYEGESATPAQGRIVSVNRFFLDRHPVTNALYREFVAAGGYEKMALWDDTIWTAIFDLVDQTGAPGPRYWKNGTFLPGGENLPVVGVNWYEASAYARWVGKRLPSDAEWVKAGSWPVPISSKTHMQRKYPWGDSMDIERANVWGAATGRIVPVTDFAEGMSVGGIYQLVGNVWEWTGGNYRLDEEAAGQAVLSTPLKSIRGGAYDTYFDNQATCQFQSGENPLSRRHNIGFRCVVGVCDLSLSQAVSPETVSTEASDELPISETEEVNV